METKTPTIHVRKHKNLFAGFTLIEALVGLAIFAVLMTGVITTFALLSRTVKIDREKTIVASLTNSRLETVRNLPYSEVGTLNGNPHGNLPDLTDPENVTIESGSYRLYYEITYQDDPADGTMLLGNDSAPNDYKQVKLFVTNVSTGMTTNFLTTVSPQGLESLNNAGALAIQVINAQGQPVPGASVHIENMILVPNIVLDRTTDANGNVLEVGLPASVNGYHIVATKAGYSTDQTYPITPQNPNPIKPDATILNGKVTQVSFSIDLLSDLLIRTLGLSCENLNGVNVNVSGEKLIGVNPDVLKFNQNFSSVNGAINLTGIEWDTYTPTLLTGQGLMVYGTSPVQRIDVLPGTSQTFTLILGPYSTNSLLVIVKDAATGMPLEGANVHLQKGGSEPQDYYGTTGGSVLSQIDWTGGSGQANYTDHTMYFADDGFVDSNSIPTGLKLLKTSGRYADSGTLISSTFDTGSTGTNYTTITWGPTSQNPGTELKFQIATNNDNATWNFKGPDGTDSTYYSVSGTNISASHDGDRYLRYKVFLSTTNDKKTPVLTSLNINYVSGCFTPGQTMFANLTAGNNYALYVNLAGYAEKVIDTLTITNNQTIEVLMNP
ncbi:MAG: prepilin-type N-terminal cleavage/methylation domain-containing protein [Candidatus Saccharibacteria bacterium]